MTFGGFDAPPSPDVEMIEFGAGARPSALRLLRPGMAIAFSLQTRDPVSR